MKHKHSILAFSVLTLIGLAFLAHSFVSGGWGTRKPVELENQPTHVAVPPGGKLTSAHIEGEDIHAQSSAAELKGGMDGGSQVDGIESRAKADTLVPAKQGNSTVQRTSHHSIQNDDFSVSPFKGPADAPVAIAVFSDFQ